MNIASRFTHSILTFWLIAGTLAAEAALTPSGTPSKPGKPGSKSVATAESILGDAQAAYARGDKAEALSLINKAIKAEPDYPRGYFARARLHTASGESQKAVEDFDQAIRLNPADADSYHLRGVEHFFLGHTADSVRDFNQYIAINPAGMPYHWQRGIALYYAEQYAEGRRQFEAHQTVNAQDVENSAWHYFCVARAEGVDKARSLWLPVTSDPRIPMMQIQALMSGTGTPEQVLQAAEAVNASAATRQRQLFYAHLYLGLYYEVHGDMKKSREHIGLSLPQVAKDDYMGRVAMVHDKLRKEGDKPPAKAKPRGKREE
ncbi:MAG: tetratricopeptide repeat protein [Verrucomicrobia bacterium]|nr:tetratricopeptide repeat protein [Verrucomicrobiota bacterium]